MEDNRFDLRVYFSRAEKARDALLLSWPELAQVLGISYATLKRIKAGSNNASYKTKRMIKAFVEEHEGK